MVLGSLAVYSSLPHTDYHKEYLWFWKMERGIIGSIFEASCRVQCGHAAKPSSGLCGEAENYPQWLAECLSSAILTDYDVLCVLQPGSLYFLSP